MVPVRRFMSVTYVTSGLLEHLPQIGREISGGVIKNNPTSKRTPTWDHGWVGWRRAGFYHSFRSTRTGFKEKSLVAKA